MSPFLRRVIERVDSEREERILTTQGRDLRRADGPETGIPGIGNGDFRSIRLTNRRAAMEARRAAIARLKRLGVSTPDIAASLGISERQLRHAMAKKDDA
jgi:DNA-binding NarL/FixJ family response regulator